jgi:ABC-2 type transport system ATP-binding protein
VFVSSHLMSEMELMAERFVIIGRGRLIADVSAAELAGMASRDVVHVRTPDGELLRRILADDGVEVRNADGDDRYDVTGVDSETVGRRAAHAGLVLFELTPVAGSLEETFMELTRDAVEYHAAATTGRSAR